MHFHYFFLVFLYSLLKLSIINPGKNSQDYHNIYNLRTYFNFYYLYCEKEDKLNRVNKTSSNNEESLLDILNKFIDSKMKQNINIDEQSVFESSTTKTPKVSETQQPITFFGKENEKQEDIFFINKDMNMNNQEVDQSGLSNKYFVI